MNTFLEKKHRMISLFEPCKKAEEKYQLIIELGRTLPPMPAELQKNEYIVPGCQSIVYLFTKREKENLYFSASSNALISAGLAMLLIMVYNGEPPQIVLKEKPLFLADLGITTSLTPGRSAGLASIYTRMQKDALNFLV